MTEMTVDKLLEDLEGRKPSTTGNSEAGPLPPPPARTPAEIQRVHHTILRAILRAERQRVREDDTIVPPLPDRWGWIPTALKVGIIGADLALHLAELAVIWWLVLEALR